MSDSKTFPTLYKKTSKGAQQEWTIHAEEDYPPLGAIVTRYGQTGGAIQETRDVVLKGKNIGKKNETTPYQQACAEAQAKWEKQLKKGYVQNADAAMSGEVDAVIEGGILPMLAHRYDQQGHKIQFPAYVQPKLDGHRCIAVVENGKCSLWSRTRKRINSMPHIERAVEFLFGGRTSLILDGELYHHGYRDNFEELTSLIRPDAPRGGHEVVQYHVYDIANSAPYHARLRQLDQMALQRPLVQVVTHMVGDEDALEAAFDGFLAEGYEGAMVRNSKGCYVNKRSYDLQKVKEFIDGEFKVLGVEEGRGKMAGHAIFVCMAPPDAKEPTFKAKMKGELSKLKEFFEHPERAIGRQLTVKYWGLTKKGLPRFPVAVRFREEV
jgi:DNA ligase 1